MISTYLRDFSYPIYLFIYLFELNHGLWWSHYSTHVGQGQFNINPLIVLLKPG